MNSGAAPEGSPGAVVSLALCGRPISPPHPDCRFAGVTDTRSAAAHRRRRRRRRSSAMEVRLRARPPRSSAFAGVRCSLAPRPGATARRGPPVRRPPPAAMESRSPRTCWPCSAWWRGTRSSTRTAAGWGAAPSASLQRDVDARPRRAVFDVLRSPCLSALLALAAAGPASARGRSRRARLAAAGRGAAAASSPLSASARGRPRPPRRLDGRPAQPPDPRLGFAAHRSPRVERGHALHGVARSARAPSSATPSRRWRGPSRAGYPPSPGTEPREDTTSGRCSRAGSRAGRDRADVHLRAARPRLCARSWSPTSRATSFRASTAASRPSTRPTLTVDAPGARHRARRPHVDAAAAAYRPFRRRSSRNGATWPASPIPTGWRTQRCDGIDARRARPVRGSRLLQHRPLPVRRALSRLPRGAGGYRGRYLYHAPPTVGAATPTRRTCEQIRARYDGALRSIDRAIAAPRALRRRGPDRTRCSSWSSATTARSCSREPGECGHGDALDALPVAGTCPSSSSGPGRARRAASDAQVRLHRSGRDPPRPAREHSRTVLRRRGLAPSSQRAPPALRGNRHLVLAGRCQRRCAAAGSSIRASPSC